MLKTSKVEVIEDTNLDSNKIYVLSYDKQSKKDNVHILNSLMK